MDPAMADWETSNKSAARAAERLMFCSLVEELVAFISVDPFL
jgi:hypothetical protein